MSDPDIREATRGFIALVAAHLNDLDTDTYADLTQDIATEGGPNRLPRLLAVGVAMTTELIHELSVATGRSMDEILQEHAARWAG